MTARREDGLRDGSRHGEAGGRLGYRGPSRGGNNEGMGRKGAGATGTGAEGAPSPRPGLGRVLRRLTPGTGPPGTEEPQEEAPETGATPIADCHDREWVAVTGTLRSVTLQPRGAGHVLEADLWDGTGQVTLVWLGRHEIHGIEPGRHIVVHGRFSYPGGRPTIFNPGYELRPEGTG